MKALTVTQPFATLVAIGAKKIETRSWSTSFRGPLAIHAAKGYPDRGLRFDEPFYSALWRAGIKPDMALPTGAIVAVCRICAVTKIGQVAVLEHAPGYIVYGRSVWTDEQVSHVISDQERAFGDYAPGRYAWLLANVRELPEPIPMRGALGLWEWEGEL